MRITWLSPGDPAQRTGGYLWNARMVEALRAAGHEVRMVALDGTWPLPGLGGLGGLGDGGPLDDVPSGDRVVADGLCWPGLGEAGRALVRRCRVAVVVHSRLGREAGLSREAAIERDRLERESWVGCALVATSSSTAVEVGGAVVIPGTAPAPRSTGSGEGRVLTVANLTPGKGHPRLLEALRQVDRPWTLRCAGAPRDPEWARHLRGSSRDLPVDWLGELDDAELDHEYDQADLVVQASDHESFGMAVAEAVVRGLPVVTTPAGALDHLPAGAVRVADPDRLADPIRALLHDPTARAKQAQAAWDARSALPDWPAQAARLSAVLQ